MMWKESGQFEMKHKWSCLPGVLTCEWTLFMQNFLNFWMPFNRTRVCVSLTAQEVKIQCNFQMKWNLLAV